MTDELHADELHEPSYLHGERDALRGMLSFCLQHLNVEGGYLVEAARLTREREDTIVQLRALCRDLGVEWPEGLYLADVIEKHVARAAGDRVRLAAVLGASLGRAIDTGDVAAAKALARELSAIGVTPDPVALENAKATATARTPAVDERIRVLESALREALDGWVDRIDDERTAADIERNSSANECHPRIAALREILTTTTKPA